ncbi:membrane protein insertase YidC [Hippea maritima]|uniref:Membrane protein insertase YidC n=1 Tax=Hippea maritima (strain ATCC 700847 / DSM 10411 / MH2) TaxID=760142 RepID=F2LWU2_HIPMA|nr:membrane protein insertase YidC [Hippea maritima]AEA33070.1 Membrane protein oxaA [Hippea maritima DSM 10411]
MKENNEKRILMAILVVTILITAYTYFFLPKQQPTPKNSNATKAKQVDHKQQLLQQTAKTTAKKQTDLKEKLITVETDNYILKISSLNGSIKELTLKKYSINKANVELVKSSGYYNTLETVFENRQLEDMEENTPYKPNSYRVELSKLNKNFKLILKKSNDNYTIIKTFSFKDGDYAFDFNVRVLKNNQPVKAKLSVYAGPDLGDLQKAKYSHLGAVALVDNDKIRTDKKIKPDEDIHWIALESKYFCFAFLPQNSNSLLAGYTKLNDGNYVYVNLESPAKLTIYAGPKSKETIAAVDHKLDKIIRFGMFGFIGKPLLYVLNWLYSIFGNYGVAIIVLTFLIRLIFYPLSFKSFKSMKEMAKLQPKLKELQAKYKGKPDQLNKATMELYKKHKVNPFGGCLPVVIQIPVFFALYNVLLNAIELRGAPFMLWITDLSSKDPYYVLPILMGLTMYVQQKLTPATGDPTQQKIMMFMPLIFTFMFMGFPSGLVLYWATNNLLTIAQQFIDSQILKAQEKKQKHATT